MRFGGAGNLESAGMAVGAGPSRRDVGGVAHARVNPLEQPAGEAAAKDAGHDGEGRVVLVGVLPAQVADGEGSQRQVDLPGQVNAWSRFGCGIGKLRHWRLFHRPAGEQPFQALLHPGGFEIAPHRQRNVFGEEIPLVESQQIGAGDAADVLEFRGPAVGRGGAVHEGGELAGQDPVGIVIAAGNRAAQLHLRQIDLVDAEGRNGQNVAERRQHFGRIFRQGEERDLSGGFADGGFHSGGHVLQLAVQLLSSHLAGSPGAHRHSGQRGDAHLAGWIEEIPSVNARHPADHGHLAILDQEQLHAVGQSEGGGLGSFDEAEWRKLEVAQRVGGCGGRGGRGGGRTGAWSRLRGRLRRGLGIRQDSGDGQGEQGARQQP